ncbi:MAG: DNA-binding response regulator [Bacteroidetes bacterium]|nr:response regulator transcription factor [Bacteroidia bacterium]PCH69668.1 MAG: DNA-binding response regulator [Bacteroidota bacterium]
MIKSLIVDDEVKARENLQCLLTEYSDKVNVVANEGSVSDAVESFRKHKPDLVFLDIDMCGESGFDFLDKVKNEDFEVVFVTAHNQHAIRAFKYSAIDYILKPIDIEELLNAVNKAEQRRNSGNKSYQIDQLLANLDQTNNKVNRLALSTMEGLTFVELENIIRCEAKDNYTYFHITNETNILVSKTIKFYEELLAENEFFRVHQSHLINVNHVKKYVRGDGGYVVMSDGSDVVISRRKKEPFLVKLATI